MLLFNIFSNFAEAATTDKNVYNTNIKAFINDNRIPCHVINSEVVLMVEDLKNYGFDITWNSKNRSYSIEINIKKEMTPLTNIKDFASSTVACLYREDR
jgi:hypothetical protein